MSNLLKLADRVEALSGPDREAFEAAYAACNGGRLFEQPASDGFQKTFAKWERFRRFLDAEAWLDAAMMLVPKGWDWALYSGGDGTKPEAQLETADMRSRYATDIEMARGYAATAALALCAAALRARHAVEGPTAVMKDVINGSI